MMDRFHSEVLRPVCKQHISLLTVDSTKSVYPGARSREQSARGKVTLGIWFVAVCHVVAVCTFIIAVVITPVSKALLFVKYAALCRRVREWGL